MYSYFSFVKVTYLGNYIVCKQDSRLHASLVVNSMFILDDEVAPPQV